MKPEEQTLSGFTELLASSSPSPGGGGAAALSGALGAALASMVASLTVGKKKYAAFETRLREILPEAKLLYERSLLAIGEDEKCFLPLSRAYGVPKDDPARAAIMEDALHYACSAPLEVMKLASETIELHHELAEKGGDLVISDVGVGVQCARSALLGASLNIRINIGLMKDNQFASELKAETDSLLKKYTALADETYELVQKRLG
ncbi:MAG: cyclodeaminase/cyclohydrolase family protein [Oscillospiraceae bacterium]|nr:cyclodeaminase/cyclohydrolase family protein [Oscillospiraceae bacterium]